MYNPEFYQIMCDKTNTLRKSDGKGIQENAKKLE